MVLCFYNTADVIVLRKLLQVTAYLFSCFVQLFSFFCSRGDLINVTFIIFCEFFFFLRSYARVKKKYLEVQNSPSFFINMICLLRLTMKFFFIVPSEASKSLFPLILLCLLGDIHLDPM